MHKYIYILFLFLTALQVKGQPKNEIRAAWITTAYGLDWPKNKATSSLGIRKQKQELINILDKLKEANINTVLFQARLRGDVIYPSDIEPFNEMLTGKEGQDPGYDPMAFALDECHKRGMECHAWIVTVSLGSNKHIKDLGNRSVTLKYPKMCKRYRNEWFLDPGNPQAKEYLFSIVKEIITKYDVDGVHFDYIRYPENAPVFPDNDTFRKYGKGKNLKEWRRDNITAIVRRLYQGIKEMKPWVKVSSAPIGKFNDLSRYSSKGWNAYNTVYQDAQGWIHEGIQDILFPMLYFKGNNFYPFALDWQEKSFGRFIVPGLGIYFLHPSEGNWPLSEIERQIYFTRSNNFSGQAHYRAQFLVENTQHLQDELVNLHYAYPALQPAMKWQDSIPPTAPENLNCTVRDGNTYLKWTSAKDNDIRNAPFYTVYASESYPVDISASKNIIAQRIYGNEFTYSTIYPWESKRYFAVTACDRYGNESKAVQLSQPHFTPFVSSTGYELILPSDANYTDITIVDITGQCVLETEYSERVSIVNLKSGSYRIILTDKNGKNRAGGMFLKWM